MDEKNVKDLVALAAKADMQALPPPTLARLGGALIELKKPKEAADFLQRAYWQYPADFWICHYLARAYQIGSPPDPAAAE